MYLYDRNIGTRVIHIIGSMYRLIEYQATREFIIFTYLIIPMCIYCEIYALPPNIFLFVLDKTVPIYKYVFTGMYNGINNMYIQITDIRDDKRIARGSGIEKKKEEK